MKISGNAHNTMSYIQQLGRSFISGACGTRPKNMLLITYTYILSSKGVNKVRVE